MKRSIVIRLLETFVIRLFLYFFISSISAFERKLQYVVHMTAANTQSSRQKPTTTVTFPRSQMTLISPVPSTWVADDWIIKRTTRETSRSFCCREWPFYNRASYLLLRQQLQSLLPTCCWGRNSNPHILPAVGYTSVTKRTLIARTVTTSNLDPYKPTPYTSRGVLYSFSARQSLDMFGSGCSF